MVTQQKSKVKQMNEIEKFNFEKKNNIKKQSEKRSLGIDFINKTVDTQYTYNFSWLGRPIIQYPQDIVAMQELIWKVKPDLIIETGIAHGGSLIFTASMLTLLETCGEIKNGRVLGIDIDIREHNKKAIQDHPMSKKITMFEGSSISDEMIKKVNDFAKKGKRIMVILDSNHTHDHVLAELEAYANLVSKDSYCIIFDTVIEDMPDNSFPNRPWGKGNNPKTAVWKYLKTHSEFEIDESVQNKQLITVAPDGYLKRIK
jgi:cephalosporin hydroxylase